MSFICGQSPLLIFLTQWKRSTDNDRFFRGSFGRKVILSRDVYGMWRKFIKRSLFYVIIFLWKTSDNLHLMYFLFNVLQRLSNICHVVRFVAFNDAAKCNCFSWTCFLCFAMCSPSSSSARDESGTRNHDLLALLLIKAHTHCPTNTFSSLLSHFN